VVVVNRKAMFSREGGVTEVLASRAGASAGSPIAAATASRLDSTLYDDPARRPVHVVR